MADKDFVVKNGLVVNTYFSANSTSVKVQGTFNDASANSLSQTLTDGATI